MKLRGVRVGRVTSLDIRYDEKKNESVVAVVCELNRDMVTDPTGLMIDVSSREALEELVRRGLRAKLEVAGLATGLLFVQLEFLDPKEHPIDRRVTDSRYVVVPAVQSAIAEFQAGLSEVLANLKRVDLATPAKDISTLAATAKKQMESIDLKGLAEQWKKTGEQFETLAKNPEFKKTFDNLNAVVGDLRAMIAKLDAQIEPTQKEFAATMAEAKKTLAEFNTTATAAQGFIASHGGIGEEVATTLVHLNEAADAVKRLADFLERNPNALITGRKRPQ